MVPQLDASPWKVPPEMVPQLCTLFFEDAAGDEPR